MTTEQPKPPRARVHTGSAQPAPAPTQPAAPAEAETPSQTLVKASLQQVDVTDSRGRVLTVRRLGALDRMRLFAAAGAELSKNEQWIGLAALAASCVKIDGDQVPKPVSRLQIEALVERVDDEGFEAIAQAYSESFGVTAEDDVRSVAKN